LRKQTFTQTVEGMKKVSDLVYVGETDFAYTIVERSDVTSEAAFSVQYVKKDHLKIIESL